MSEPLKTKKPKVAASAAAIMRRLWGDHDRPETAYYKKAMANWRTRNGN